MSNYFNLNEGIKDTKKRFTRLSNITNHKYFNKKVIIIVLILLAVPVTVILALTSQDNRQYAANEDNVQILTNKLIKDGDPNLVRESSNVSSAVSDSKDRKELMLKMANENPKDFLLNALPNSVTQNFDPLVKENIEKEQILRGELVILVIDDFEAKKSKIEYKLNQYDANKKLIKSYDLNFTNNIPNLKTGDPIEVKGYVLENEIIAEDIIRGVEQSDLGAKLSNPIGDQKTLVMLVNFQDDAIEKVSKDEAKQLMFDGPYSVNNFYKVNSNGSTSFSGDIVGYYTLPYTLSDCGSLGKWQVAANEMAKRAGISLDAYTRIVYIYSATGCTGSSASYIGGNPSYAWINTRDYSPTWGYRHAIHELGHSLGIAHSNALNCNGEPIRNFNLDFPSDCEIYDYGDPTDVMGSNQVGYQVNLTSLHKQELGFIDSNQTLSVKDNATVTIQALEKNLPGYKSVNIEIPNSSYVYNLGYRKNAGYTYDYNQEKWVVANFPNGIKDGASLHLWKQFFNVYSNNSYDSQIINMNPSVTDFLSSSFTDGKVFNDADNGIKMTQISHNDDNVQMKIELDKTICRRGTPDFQITPITQVGNSGQTFVYDIQIKNNDLSNCAPVEFKLSGITVGPGGYGDGWLVFSKNNFILAPGESTTATVTFKSQLTQISGNNIIRISLKSNEARHSIDQGINIILTGSKEILEVTPKKITIEKDGQPVEISVKRIDSEGNDITSDTSFEWAILNDKGKLSSETGPKVLFTPLQDGYTVVFVTSSLGGNDFVSAQIPVSIIPNLLTPTLTPSVTPIPQKKKIVLYPIADSYVRKSEPNKNFGSSKSLEVSNNPVEITYLKFDLSQVAGKQILTSNLKLKVRAEFKQNNYLTLKYISQNNWSENTLTFKNRPTFESPWLDFLPGKLNVMKTMRIPLFVPRDNTITLGLFTSPTSSKNSGAYYSAEAALGNRPQLVIEYK